MPKAEHAIWKGVSTAGTALVTAYAGYSMTRFEPSGALTWEKHLRLPVKLVGYGLVGYAAYDLVRAVMLKAK